MRSLSSSVIRPFSTPRANWRSISAAPALGELAARLAGDRGHAGLDAELGDARAHRPQPDDAYLLDNSRALGIHSVPLSLFGWLIWKTRASDPQARVGAGVDRADEVARMLRVAEDDDLGPVEREPRARMPRGLPADGERHVRSASSVPVLPPSASS